MRATITAPPPNARTEGENDDTPRDTERLNDRAYYLARVCDPLSPHDQPPPGRSGSRGCCAQRLTSRRNGRFDPHSVTGVMDSANPHTRHARSFSNSVSHTDLLQTNPLVS
jgi:hypothetical protein